MCKWYKVFTERDCICKGKSPGKQPVSEETASVVRATFDGSPTKQAARQLNMAKSTAYKILQTYLKCKSYQYQ
jgi:DNA invertase Pin-like site-specific DNA recombinase